MSNEAASIGIIFMVLSSVFLIWIGSATGKSEMKREAIKCGVGYYNPTNGGFNYKTWPKNDLK